MTIAMDAPKAPRYAIVEGVAQSPAAAQLSQLVNRMLTQARPPSEEFSRAELTDDVPGALPGRVVGRIDHEFRSRGALPGFVFTEDD